MHKGLLLAILGVAVVGVGGWILFTTTPSEEGQNQEQEENVVTDQRGSMEQLVARGGSWECSVSSETENSTSSGVVYVANGMIRGDFTSVVPQLGTVESHMIVRDEYVHTWSSAMSQGVKLPVAMDASAEVSAGENPYQAEYDYSCKPWSGDNSRFVLPSNVTFVEFEAQGGASTGAGPSCSSCEMVPAGAQRNACLQALGC